MEPANFDEVEKKMFCPDCGKEIPEISKFCKYCGTPVTAAEAPGNAGTGGDPQMPPGPELKLKKKTPKWLIPVILVSVAVVIAGIVLLLYTRSSASRLNRQISLGERYLSELDYEEAVAAFTAALEIDPANPEAQDGLVRAYLAWADSLVDAGKTDKAIAVLEKALQIVDDDRLNQKLDDLKGASAAQALEEPAVLYDRVSDPEIISAEPLGGEVQIIRFRCRYDGEEREGSVQNYDYGSLQATGSLEDSYRIFTVDVDEDGTSELIIHVSVFGNTFSDGAGDYHILKVTDDDIVELFAWGRGKNGTWDPEEAGAENTPDGRSVFNIEITDGHLHLITGYKDGGAIFGYRYLVGYLNGEPVYTPEGQLTANDLSVSLISTDVSDYPEVRVYLNVEDSDGNMVELYSPTAGIRERIAGGAEIERSVKRIERLEGNQGINIDIVADKSGSMRNDLAQMQSIMTDFIYSLDYASGDRAEIITFDSYIMYMCTYTNDAGLLAGGISNMVADGETALYDALIEGITNAGGQEGFSVVIGFTDGADNASIHTPEEVIGLANALQVPVYLIGTSGADAGALEWIASSTGGTFCRIDTIGDMQQFLSQIYTTEKDQYCLIYDSDPAADPYSERTISCHIRDKDHEGTLPDTVFTAVEKWVREKHDSRYEFVTADISWSEANSAAIRKGGHLATITSEEEMRELSAMAEENGLTYYWIGGYTSVRSGQAFGHWVTGEPFVYTAWCENEPSRNDLDGKPEMYMMLWKYKGNWSWNDQRNDLIGEGLKWFEGNLGYIIEYEE